MFIEAVPPPTTRNARTDAAQERLRLAGRLLFAALGLLLEIGCVASGAALVRWIVPASMPVAGPGPLAIAYALLAVTLACISLPTRQALTVQCMLLASLDLGLMTAGRFRPDAAAAELLGIAFALAGILAIRKARARLLERQLGFLLPDRPMAFIGNSASAARMLNQLRTDPRSRAVAVGFFDDRNARPGPLTDLLPCLGSIDDIVTYIHEAELDEVYMAMPWSASERISQLLGRLRFLPLTVRLIPDHLPPVLAQRDDAQIEGVVMPTLMVPPFSMVGGAVKRAVDLFACCCLLVPLVPLFVAVALVIKLDSRGPVFFRQPRSGQYGRSFRIYKFRTLRTAQADTAAETLVTRGDNRVTRVGRFLRKYSIDELPQVINVILGDMSLVGPRPHAPRAKANGRIYAELMPEYMLRYRVKPGMTGWAQVNGWRGNTETEEQLRKRVEFDFDYIGHWSMRRDIRILLRTLPSMLLPPVANT